jgi:hypothetical protein
MDGPPPPVPPKDSPPVKATIPMDPGRVTPRPASSASKRKREAQDEHAYNPRSNHSEASDAEAYANTHTPKRSRPSLPGPDHDASDDATPVQQHNIRRKKGVNNLSNLNLRHAAERQARLHAERQPVPRESRFQEGSLTDRPSNKPPTVFTRFIRTDSGRIEQVDALMDDYHNGMPSPTGEIDVNREQAQLPPSAAPTTPRPEGADENNNGFLFRFGRSIAASFHPVRMWKQVWEETTEELRQKNIAEYQRKKALKEEAERRYAEMKASGQFESRTISRTSATDSSIKTRDSGVMLEQETPSLNHKRNTSYGSQLAPPTIGSSNYSESEAPDNASSVVKTLKSRLHFKRPSLQNLRFDLKRTRSEYNIGAAANIHRDSSSSVSPVKAELEGSSLRKSHSRVDMRRQHKLSKRVSDLEVKLQYARRELDDALVQASPALKMGNKYERVTPNSTLRRPRFIPTKLESLPSERLLDPSMYYNDDEDADKVTQDRANAVADLEGISIDEDSHMMDAPQDNEEETIRASHVRPYPARASSLFSLNNNNIENSTEETAAGATKPTSDDMENNTADVKKQSTATADAKKRASGYASLDAKLKALDANVKMAAKKPAQRKKRKTGDDFKDYTPEDDDEDDENADWDKIGSKSKRRKSNTSATKRKSTSKSVQDSEEPAVAATTEGLDNDSDEVDTPSKQNDEAGADRNMRMSIDSQAGALEPVLEESEEATFAPNGDPIKKSKYRSSMPIYQPGSDEDLMTRAAAAARVHRSHSPPDAEKAVLSKQHHDTTQQIRAGSEGGSAKSAKSAKSNRSRIPKQVKAKVDQNFEWPEDVF